MTNYPGTLVDNMCKNLDANSELKLLEKVK